jgi:hypothetical protein
VKILTTSREGLGVTDEQLIPVSSLDLRAATDLFVERANSVAADTDDLDAVTEICDRLDGIPLAIELAASRMASMSASEVRDRLDNRFRLLVGSRRGLERHQTLRHAVAWSYDLLDDAEKALLIRCSVFAGGFDLQSACLVAGSDDIDDIDDYAMLDLLDALVRKSLLVADRSAGRTRFSMLETIRQFAEDQLVARGEATEARTAHSRYFAAREDAMSSRWDGPCQREAYDWIIAELPNLRSAFRWAADHGDLDTGIAIVTYASFIGFAIGILEPIAWAEELIEPARIAGHPQLATLYGMAAWCWMAGRIEEAVGYADACQSLIDADWQMPFGSEGFLAVAYQAVGQPARAVEWCRSQLARGLDTHGLTRTYLVISLVFAGSVDEAMTLATGLVDAAASTHNPYAHTFALLAYGFAFREADPVAAADALRSGLEIAQDSGNRYNETNLTLILSGLEAQHGEPLAALDHLALTIRTYHETGNSAVIRTPLAVLAALFDRLERYESAATIASYASTALAAQGAPEINTAILHLRSVLGDKTYESLARKGETMTTAAMVTYAYDQIDQARAELEGLWI